jgi:hypothetical protein
MIWKWLSRIVGREIQRVLPIPLDDLGGTITETAKQLFNRAKRAGAYRLLVLRTRESARGTNYGLRKLVLRTARQVDSATARALRDNIVRQGLEWLERFVAATEADIAVEEAAQGTKKALLPAREAARGLARQAALDMPRVAAGERPQEAPDPDPEDDEDDDDEEDNE